MDEGGDVVNLKVTVAVLNLVGPNVETQCMADRCVAGGMTSRLLDSAFEKPWTGGGDE